LNPSQDSVAVTS